MKTSTRHSSNAAFTLIELLVVIAIISILMAIIFPVFASARANARKTVCVSNMGQIALALRMYADDYDGGFPRVGIMVSPGNWGPVTSYLAPQYYQGALQPYILQQRVNALTSQGTLGAQNTNNVWWDPSDTSVSSPFMWGSFVTNGYLTCNTTFESQIASPAQMIYSGLRADMPEWAIWNGVWDPSDNGPGTGNVPPPGVTPPAGDPFWTSEYFDMGIDPYNQGTDPTDEASECYYTTGKICPPLSLFPNDPNAQDWQPSMATGRYSGMAPYAFADGHVKVMQFAATYTSLTNNLWNLH